MPRRRRGRVRRGRTAPMSCANRTLRARCAVCGAPTAVTPTRTPSPVVAAGGELVLFRALPRGDYFTSLAHEGRRCYWVSYGSETCAA